MSSDRKCFFCGSECEITIAPNMHTVSDYTCKYCGRYLIDQRFIITTSTIKQEENKFKIACILNEMRLEGQSGVALSSKTDMENKVLGLPQISVDDILKKFPKKASDFHDRALLNLSRLANPIQPFENIRLDLTTNKDYLHFFIQDKQGCYTFLRGLAEQGYIRFNRVQGREQLDVFCLTTEFWEMVENPQQTDEIHDSSNINRVRNPLLESIYKAYAAVEKLAESPLDIDNLSEAEMGFADSVVIDYLTERFGEQDDALGNWPRDWHECPEAFELWKKQIEKLRVSEAMESLDQLKGVTEAKQETRNNGDENPTSPDPKKQKAIPKDKEDLAETGQGNKDAKSKGEGGLIDNTKPTIKKLLSRNFIKATIKHIPYCGSYLFDIIYGVDGMKEQKEKTDLTIIAKNNIDRTTPEPEKEKGGWELVKKISLILGIMVSLIVIVGALNKYIRKDKPTIERIKTPNLTGNSVDVNNVVYETRPRAGEIIEEIERLPVFEQKVAAENYRGRTFKWMLRFEFLVHEKDGMVYVLCKASPVRGEVSFNINADAKENLKIKKIKKGEFLDVSGEIKDISLAREPRIRLKDVRLEFVD